MNDGSSNLVITSGCPQEDEIWDIAKTYLVIAMAAIAVALLAGR
jgi:hypothetical protein